ncbi:MAG TPA: substrate-binding domain-containing protein [Thermoproteota archaeon]|nr:substrate-binding domain-containing protein [Thermoproteota archaeon]
MNLRTKFWIAAAACLIVVGGALVAYSARPRALLVIATTTSTVDTGLLDYLKPYFDLKFHANMTWLYLGTGQALAVAARGDADILLVHDRAKENAFVASGNGTHRVTVMYNDFIIVGPSDDPAGIARATSTVDAFQKIAAAAAGGGVTFVSRGDLSGTNSFELRIWSRAGISPKGKSWYFDGAGGMAPTLRVTNEKQAYTVSDRGTWLKLKSTMGDALNLQILYQGDKDLLNPYGLILLNDTRYPNIQSQLAKDFFLFMISDEGQSLIADYTVGGQQLFTPVFGKPETIGLPLETAEIQYWVAQLQANGMKPPSWVSANPSG